MSFVLCQAAFAEDYRFDEQQSRIGFSIGHLTGTARGEFRDFEGTLSFDQAQPERSKVKVTIQVDSIDTGNAKRDAHLKEQEYFASSNHPTITFESAGFRQRGDHYVVTGPLTIKGVEKNITLHVRLERSQELWARDAEALTFESELQINRMDFGVSAGRPAVGEQVTIELRIKAFSD